MNNRLAARAGEQGADPCDVAIDAMPGYVLGDLENGEAAWVQQHTDQCRSCNADLETFQSIDSVLTEAESGASEDARAPRFSVPGVKRCEYGFMTSPVGDLFVALSDEGVCEITWHHRGSAHFLQELRERGFDPVENEAAVAPVVEELSEYFAGRRKRFDVPVDLSGISPFTRSVLEATAEIGFGSLSTYRDVARKIGKPAASRAVGGALGRNPVPVIVPCHRVIKSDLTLGGYTGGLGIKEGLLAIEGTTLGP